MRRFFSGEKLIVNKNVFLRGDEFHHLKNVCRLQIDEKVELLNGQGQLALGKIIGISKKDASIEILNVEDVPPLPEPRMQILLCVPRFQKMDIIIQKCAELGVESLTPVVSDRSFIKKLSKDLVGKTQRWQKIALEASKQSGRAWPLEIGDPTTLYNQIEGENLTGLFLYEGQGTQDIKTALTRMPQSANIKVFIGAEGGFSLEEVQAFKAKGLDPVTLGPLVLRVETACITIASVIQYHFGLMR